MVVDPLKEFEDDREKEADRIKKGPMLEELTSLLFEMAGFDTKVRDRSTEYEIDVLAQSGKLDLIIECKNRENESIEVKNLIHEWTGKKDEIGIRNALLVLNGAKITQNDRKLAKKRNIRLWNKSQLQQMIEYTKRSKEKAKPRILSDLRADNEKTKKLRKERRSKWKPPYKLICEAYTEYGGKKWDYVIIGINEETENKFWEILNTNKEYSDYFIFQNTFSKDQERFYPAKTILLPMWRLDNRQDEKIIKYADEQDYYCIVFRDIEIDLDLERYNIEVKEIEDVAGQIKTQLEHWK